MLWLQPVNEAALSELLSQVAAGQLDVATAMSRLTKLPFADLGFARVDHHRSLRAGFPEVVFCQGKRPEHVLAIFKELLSHGSAAFGTRATKEHADVVTAALPDCRYDPSSRLLFSPRPTATEPRPGPVLVICAGTSDLPVADEAAITAEFFGCHVERLCDVGVAGIHRLLAAEDKLRAARIIIAVAGMEGALPSAVAGLSGRPVIAVPTSIGYGASFSGLAALLGMLSSCASGVTVVNIDNGFGAGYAAALTLRSASYELPASRITP